MRIATSGRRKRFCSDACRQAAFRNEMAGMASATAKEIWAREDAENIGQFLSRNADFALPRSSDRFSKQLKFEKQNGVTYKLTDGHQVNTGGGRASRALAYIVEVSDGRWIARVRNLGSDLLPFGAAKQEAVRLYHSRDKCSSDWIHELDLRAARDIDRTALASEKRKSPIDLMGGGRPWLNPKHVARGVIRNIIEVESCKPLKREDTQQETPKGDDYRLEYDKNGYPELPVCLDRRKPEALRQAA